MRTENQFPSALLIDSGGGWLGSGSGGCLSFEKPDFTFFSSGTGGVFFHGDKREHIDGDPVAEIEKKTSEGYIALGFFGYGYLQNTDDGRPISGKLRKKTSGFEPPLLGFHFYHEKSVCRKDKFFNGKSFPANCGKYSDIFAGFNSREKSFIENVEKIKSRIRDGDIYQVNISENWKLPVSEKPLDMFLNFFNYQPVPFASYMDFGKFQFLSGSMEMFLRKTGRQVVSCPIKGTARRGKDTEEDSIIKKNLIESEKEKSELLMITDLIRNDLSRICVPSTVKTRQLFNIKKYKTLFHMESEVEGILKKNISLSQIIQKTFPPGSVTGAPKTKALEIIDALEPHSRGPYCGAAGIFYPDGNFCLSVSIRCLQVFRHKAVCWSGAGIVWDSDSEKEFREIALKLRALGKSLKRTAI